MKVYIKRSATQASIWDCLRSLKPAVNASPQTYCKPLSAETRQLFHGLNTPGTRDTKKGRVCDRRSCPEAGAGAAELRAGLDSWRAVRASSLQRRPREEARHLHENRESGSSFTLKVRVAERHVVLRVSPQDPRPLGAHCLAQITYEETEDRGGRAARSSSHGWGGQRRDGNPGPVIRSVFRPLPR